MPALRRVTSARPSSSLTVSGHVEAWPSGFLDQLPPRNWTAVLAKPRQDKLLVSALKRSGIAGLMFYERRLHRYPGKGSAEAKAAAKEMRGEMQACLNAAVQSDQNAREKQAAQKAVLDRVAEKLGQAQP